MLTPTHTLLALVALSKPGERKRNFSILAGSLLPDLAISLWAPYQSFVNGVSGPEMWDKLYFEPPMQNLIAWFNSIPIYGAMLLIGFAAKGKTWGKLLMFFALAALIHIATDMPVHAEDAYRHFWPLSDWRYYSRISYWNVEYHAVWVSKVDAALALGCIALLWHRYPLRWAKIILVGLTMFYLAYLIEPLLKSLSLG